MDALFKYIFFVFLILKNEKSLHINLIYSGL